MARHERTRHLIELGGLVHKAGLVVLAGDNRAVLLGGLLSLADELAGEERGDLLALWERRGQHAFAAGAETAAGVAVVQATGSSSPSLSDLESWL
jgi:hypothetical protein